jgi:hypothetical protein
MNPEINSRKPVHLRKKEGIGVAKQKRSMRGAVFALAAS